jgi:hypothetical protein
MIRFEPPGAFRSVFYKINVQHMSKLIRKNIFISFYRALTWNNRSLYSNHSLVTFLFQQPFSSTLLLKLPRDTSRKMRASFAALAFAMVSLVSAQAVITDAPNVTTLDASCVVTIDVVTETSVCSTSTSSWCPVCDASAYYTTTYDQAFTTFCPTGLTVYTKPVTATYSTGEVPVTTECPQGYTTAVETCTSCGSVPVTATVIVPTSKAAVATGSVTGSVTTFTGAANRENVGKVAAAVAVIGAILL